MGSGWSSENKYSIKEVSLPILLHLQTGCFPKKAHRSDTFRNAAVSRPTAANAKCQVLLLHVCLPVHHQPCTPSPLFFSFMSDIWRRNPLGAGRVLPPRETVVHLNIVPRMRERVRERKKLNSHHTNFAVLTFFTVATPELD